MSKINVKRLIINIAIPLAVGGLAALLTMGNMDLNSEITLPPLAPPSWLFPVVWTILYILMGISHYIVYSKTQSLQTIQSRVYGYQLLVNFLWSIVFFNLRQFLVSAVIIAILDILIVEMILSFRRIDKKAADLQIPYLIWCLFATYLNIAIYFLN